MRLPGRRLLVFLPLAILAVITPRPASAQCGLLRQEFFNISLERGNAFIADYVTNTRSPLAGVN